MLVHQAVERGPIYARQAGGLGHVPAGPVHQAFEIVALELGDHPLFGRVVRLVRNRNHQGVLAGVFHVLVIQRDVARLERLLRFGQHRHVLDDVLQFAHVAAPRARSQEG